MKRRRHSGRGTRHQNMAPQDLWAVYLYLRCIYGCNPFGARSQTCAVNDTAFIIIDQERLARSFARNT
jgi:hypothetical protein